ncbi:hypothetical protein [Nocardia sp. NPDC019395]|uniref:hypothetical protein n=1 Tax=Nocardia sp. NPDC019395 TaxID=3154686 RepID=UPI0033CAD125
MGRSLEIDNAGLRAAAAELARMAEDASLLVAELKAAMDRNESCWGRDRPGEIFADTYVPAARRGFDGLENLATDVRNMQGLLADSADYFAEQDQLGARNLRGIDGTGDSAPVGDGRSVHDWQPVRSLAEPGSEVALPAAGSGTRDIGSPATTSGGTPNMPPESPPAVPNAPTPERYAPPQGGPAAKPYNAADPGRSAKPLGTGASADTGARPGPAVAPSVVDSAAPKTGSPAQGPVPRSASTPWARPGSASPWVRGAESRAAPRHPDVAARQPEPAPRRPAVEARPGGNPPAPATPPRRSPGRRENAPEPVAARGESSAARIIRQLAQRHDLALTGVETVEFGVAVAREIAGAVDHILARYPLCLRGIEVTGGHAGHVAVSGPAAGEVADLTLVLGRTGPGTAIGSPDADASAFTAVLGAYARALGDVSGHRANRVAHRALIAQFLPRYTGDRLILARVVGAYRSWCGELGEDCFEHGALSPDRALVRGFIDTELRGAHAAAPARVLHALLLATCSHSTARNSDRSR